MTYTADLLSENTLKNHSIVVEKQRILADKSAYTYANFVGISLI